MENRTQHNVLNRVAETMVLLATLFSVSLSAAAEEGRVPLIEPNVKPVVIDESLIDSENFELGSFAGVMNIEDFESSFIYGARLGYHLSESLMLEANVGVTEAGETSFETLGNVPVLSDDERDYMYYSFGLTFKLPGESYFGESYAFNNNLSFNLSMGTTDFAGEKRLTGIFGVGYQLLLNDFLSVHVSAREHLYRIDVTGSEKMSFNSELTTGVSFFF